MEKVFQGRFRPAGVNQKPGQHGVEIHPGKIDSGLAQSRAMRLQIVAGARRRRRLQERLETGEQCAHQRRKPDPAPRP